MDIWKEHEQLIDDQLKLQVDISFDHHYGFMLKNGFDHCRSICDIGTGNGFFLQKVAIANPDINFIGIDSRAQMISKAMAFNQRNIEWLQADAIDDIAIKKVSSADGLIMRYFILHYPNSRDLLKKYHAVMKDNSRIWIFDVAASLFKSEPQHPGLNMIRDIFERICKVHSIDSMAADKLPSLLSEIGFGSVTVEIEPFNNRELSIPMLQRFVRQEVLLYCAFLKGDIPRSVMTEIDSFIDNVIPSPDFFFNYGIAMICAQK